MDRNSAPFVRLQELAKRPVDLTQEFTPERIGSFVAKGAGFTLFFGAERISEAVLQALFALAKETKAVAKMEAMQRGGVVNSSENRPALHTAMRDLFSPPKEPKATALAKKEIDKLTAFQPQLDRFTDCVQIGIGGSSLGPEAIYLGLRAYGKRRVHFVSNVDPDDLVALFRQLDLSKTVVIVVSKSGTTLETFTNETLAREKFIQAGLRPEDHFIAVTGEGSPMDDPKRYLASFYIWDYIGGRYSVTSMVGAVMLSFAIGMEAFLEFLRGCHEMDLLALTPDPGKNLPLLSALLGIWNRNFLHLPTVAIIPYSQALLRFPAHLQQLDMESNGKRVEREGQAVNVETGPIIWGEPGTNGQHSFYQLIHQGTTTVPLEMIGFLHSQYGDDAVVQGTTSQEKLLANLLAQSIALAQGKKSDDPNRFFPGNKPNRALVGEKLTPQAMGALLAYYEHKVAFQGFIWNINSFDQEGVQLGKELALTVIGQFAAKRGGIAEPFALSEAYLKLLDGNL